MSDSGVKIEIHLIQNFAPSNLNRDDTGQPKSATFGGFRRARISSQSSKRAVRVWWKERGTVPVGDRTKRLQQLLFDELKKDSPVQMGDDEFLREGIRVFSDSYYAASDSKKPEQTNVLLFISPKEVEICVEAIRKHWQDIKNVVTKRRDKKKQENNQKNETHPDNNVVEGANKEKESAKDVKQPQLEVNNEIKQSIEKVKCSADIALFGRMLAEQPVRNTHASCQVAHPISTHKVDMEMDFYTAVDDLNPEEVTGAGMMGFVGFNSACYYRYALVDRDQLARNLTGKTGRVGGRWDKGLNEEDYKEADKVIKAFLEAMIYAIPTGKQNSFGAQNLPSFGLLVRRQGGVPLSLANAFAKPIRPRKDDDDLVGLSIEALTAHWKKLKEVYGDQGVKKLSCFHVGQENRLNELCCAFNGKVDSAISAILLPDFSKNETNGKTIVTVNT